MNDLFVSLFREGKKIVSDVHVEGSFFVERVKMLLQCFVEKKIQMRSLKVFERESLKIHPDLKSIFQ